jgi:5-methylcytosine-specific restriction endonuclease McrA
MWDEKNMRTLCEACHKKKTAEDMKQIAQERQDKKVMVDGQKTL